MSSKAPPEHTISSNVHFIVGLTSDGHVLYAGPERVPSYCVEPYDNVHRSLQKSIDEGRVELEGQEENPMFRGSPQRTAIEAHGIDQFVSRGIYGRLKHKEATLAHLEHLKTDYDARQAKEARRV